MIHWTLPLYYPTTHFTKCIQDVWYSENVSEISASSMYLIRVYVSHQTTSNHKGGERITCIPMQVIFVKTRHKMTLHRTLLEECYTKAIPRTTRNLQECFCKDKITSKYMSFMKISATHFPHTHFWIYCPIIIMLLLRITLHQQSPCIQHVDQT